VTNFGLNLIQLFHQPGQLPTRHTVSSILPEPTNPKGPPLLVLGKLTLDLSVLKEFGYFRQGLLRYQFRIEGRKLLKFLTRLEPTQALCRRKERLLQHPDQA
jgi:hypothetical protein